MYPSLEMVEKADQEQLARWYRFLPSPTNKNQEEILKIICERFKGFNAELSKKVGFDCV